MFNSPVFSTNISVKRVRLITILIFIQWLIYENIVLAEPDAFGGVFMVILVFGFKLIFPFILFIISGPPILSKLKNVNIYLYVFSLIFFLLWSLIPTLISGNFISWIKLLPIIFFFLSILSFFSKYPTSFKLFIKLVILYVLSALLQYIIIYTFGIYNQSGVIALTGPFGLLGNTQGQFGLPGLSEPIIRLCGFWREPSIASASAFASFFYGKFLYTQGESKKWLYAGYLCFLAGILTISNAGFLAVGSAFFFGFIIGRQSLIKKILKLVFVLPIVLIFIWFALFSRSYFSENGSENPYLLALSGVRSAGNINSNEFDPSDGRLDLMNYTIKETKNNIIGKGVQITGAKGIMAPSGGLLYWMLLTGFPGLLFLLFREFNLLYSQYKSVKANYNILLLGQALIVILVQQSSYGSWMDPNYFIIASAVLLGPFWAKNKLII